MNLVALSWAGTQYCSLTPLSCQDLEVQLEAGTHPVTVGFSTVWQPLTTGIPRVLTRAVYCCVRGPNNLSTGLLSRAAFSLTHITVCLLLRYRHSECARGLPSRPLVVTSTISTTSSSRCSPLPYHGQQTTRILPFSIFFSTLHVNTCNKWV